MEEAGRLFRKYLENVIKNSENTVVSILASKWDKHKVTERELEEEFRDVEIHPISVLDGSARKVTEEITDNLLQRKKQ